MKNILLLAALLSGCASLKYPGWESVNEASSAYKQPCKEVGEELCSGGQCSGKDDSWFKKRAARQGANNFTRDYSKDAPGSVNSVKYFYCGVGIPLYMYKANFVFLTKNKINASATEADLKQASVRCNYEAHLATVDTGLHIPPTARAFIPTTNFNVNMAQIYNNQNQASDYEINKVYHELYLGVEKQRLAEECLAVMGYETIKSSEDKDLADAEKYCPGTDSAVSPCFIPGVKN